MRVQDVLRTGWQRNAAVIVSYLILWQVLDEASAAFGIVAGFRPWFPPVALDVLLLFVVGWKWWPLLPVAAALHWALFDPTHSTTALIFTVVTHTVSGGVYATAAWYARDVRRVRRPLRASRDVAWFCALFALASPAIAGSISVAVMLVLHMVDPHNVSPQFSRFIVGDSAAILTIVPSVLAALDWGSLRPPAEHRNAQTSEFIALVGVTAALVALGYGTTSPTALLDLSFVSMAWLSIRFGMRGAIFAIVAAAGASMLVALMQHASAPTLIEYQVFLIAAAMMSLLLGSLTVERWDLVAMLERRAYTDDLTGLPNREHLVQWIDAHRDSAIVLVMFDIDEMRLLNEGVGRVAADRALQDIAMRMRAGLPTSYFVARVSADEYAVAVVDERSPHAIMAEVRHFFDVPFEVEGARIFVSVSMGAIRVARAADADDMLRRVDLAVHRAKTTPTRSVVYSPELQGSGEPLLVGQLHRAVERDELCSFFQPIFKFDAQRNHWHVFGAESLLRWNHPERGILSPASFMDLLERLAISEHVGWTVVETSLRQAARWRQTIPHFSVWVNLFARQALDRNCARRIEDLLERTQMPPDALVVEINEGIVASDERDIAALAVALRALGVQVAIDDFGTGGSSLGRVREVPASILKIDRSFVAKSEVDAKAKAVASTVVRLATELGMSVVAEGVENPMQLGVMIETGCEYAQGYALGHPLPADLFEQEFLDLSPAS